MMKMTMLFFSAAAAAAAPTTRVCRLFLLKRPPCNPLFSPPSGSFPPFFPARLEMERRLTRSRAVSESRKRGHGAAAAYRLTEIEMKEARLFSSKERKKNGSIDSLAHHQSPLSLLSSLHLRHHLNNNNNNNNRTGIELIASENFTSMPVMEALGSCMTNKYSEVRDKDFQNRKENKKSKISKKKLLRRRPL